MDYKAESVKKHFEWKGKFEIKSRAEVTDAQSLSLAYTPGVAEPCLLIQKDVSLAYDLTRKWNSVAVVTDGTAVLGLGDIGPEAGMPVMEGKCVLFKEFADVDAYPICIKSKDADDIVNTVRLISGGFGGINLEDIAAPRCFEIEKRLKEVLDIPVFHDDQHGTAIVTVAGLINALRITGRTEGDAVCVISGAGAAGAAIARLMLKHGFKDITLLNSKGTINRGDSYSSGELNELKLLTNPRNIKGGLADAIKGADVFIGVSAPGILTGEMVRTMNKDAIIFAMSNPVPEIMPDIAKQSGAKVIATGRSDFPNQINNVLAFPGIFRGTLDARVKDITDDMKLAAAYALADLASGEASPEYIIPSPFDKRVAEHVAKAVFEAAKKQ